MKVYIVYQSSTFRIGEEPKILFVDTNKETSERYLKELNDRKDTYSRYYIEEQKVSE